MRKTNLFEKWSKNRLNSTASMQQCKIILTLSQLSQDIKLVSFSLITWNVGRWVGGRVKAKLYTTSVNVVENMNDSEY